MNQPSARVTGLVALVVVLLFVLIQVLSWQRTGGLNSGAFLLLLLVLGPLWAFMRGRNPDRL